MQIVDARQSFSVPGQDNITGLERSVTGNICDHDGGGVRISVARWLCRCSGMVCAVTPRRERRTLPSRIRRMATSMAVSTPIAETDALGAANHRRVDADDAAARVDQRAAGNAGIERRVGLDHALQHASARGAQRPPSAETMPAVTVAW